MTSSKYKALLLAVDLGSFSAAAKELGYTQSGLTPMMNALEDEVGFPILQRGHYGVKLTPLGERIIPKIRELVTSEDALANEIEIVRSFGDSVIRIGAYTSIATNFLPSVVERFNQEFPEVSVNIQTGTVSELYGGLLDGKFDICLGSRIPRYDLKYTTLCYDRFYAVLPKGYPVTDGIFPVSSFNGTKFLMPGLGFDDDINAVFTEYSVTPFVTPTYVDDPAILSMVEHRLGISMLSELILTNRQNQVLLVPIVPEVARNIVIAMKHDKVLSLAQKRLIAITKEFVFEYYQARSEAGATL